MSSSSAIAACALASGSPPTAGVGCSSAGQLDRRERLGELGVHRGRQVLDVGDLDHRGLGVGLDPDRARRELALDPPGDDLVLVAVLGRCAAAARRGGRRRRGRRCGGSSRRARRWRRRRRGGGRSSSGLAPRKAPSGDADAEAEAGREQLAQGAEDGRRIVRGRRLDRDLAREHDLLELAGADPLDRRGDRAPRSAPGGGDARDRASRRAGSGRASAAAASRSEASRRSRRARIGSRSAPPADDRAQRSARSGRRRAAARARAAPAAPAGTTTTDGREPPSGGEREAAGPDRAGAGGQSVGLVGEPPAHHPRAHSRDQVVEAAGPARDRLVGGAEGRRARSRRGRAAPSRTSGRSASREAKTAARRVGDLDLGGDADQRRRRGSAVARARRRARASRRSSTVEHRGPGYSRLASARGATW